MEYDVLLNEKKELLLKASCTGNGLLPDSGFDHNLYLFHESLGGFVAPGRGRPELIGARMGMPGTENCVQSLSKVWKIWMTKAPSEKRPFFIAQIDYGCLIISNRLFWSIGLGVAAYWPDLPVGNPDVWLMRESGDSRAAYMKIFEKAMGAEEREEGTITGEVMLTKILSSARIAGCSADITVTEPASWERSALPNRRSMGSILAAFLLCLFSEVRRAAKGHHVTIQAQVGADTQIVMNYEISEAFIDENLGKMPFLRFCRGLAARLGAAFCFEAEEGKVCIRLIPYRIDPAAEGLKSGIYINGRIYD